MKLIVFDIDGTLTATSGVDDECLVAAVRGILGDIEIDTNWEKYPTFTDIGIAQHIWLQRLGRPPSAEETRALEESFLDLLLAKPKECFLPLPGAIGFFESVRRSDEFAVAVATGSWRISARHKLTCAGFDAGEVPLASCNDSSTREEIMSLARERAVQASACSDFDDIIYVGDGIWDVEATRKLNWRMIGVGERINQLRDRGLKDVFADYREPDEIFRVVRG